jgi:hypothetical protein
MRVAGLNSFTADGKSVMSFPLFCQGNAVMCISVKEICGELRKRNPFYPVRVCEVMCVTYKYCLS